MPVLKSLEMFGSMWDPEYLNNRRWKSILLGENLLPLLNRINVQLSVRSTHNTPSFGFIASRFNKSIFRQVNFSVIHSDMLWFDVRCSWNTPVKK